MRSLPTIETYQTTTGEIQICVAPPHQFFVEHQQLLLDWDLPVSYSILVLQQSSISLKAISDRTNLEKDCLRAQFLRFGCSLIFSLQDLDYQSDLFDPRTGYPLLAPQGIPCDDNAVAKAILNYKIVREGSCSLLIHPVWQYRVYPSTIVTSAPQNAIESCIKEIAGDRGWHPLNRTLVQIVE